MSMDVFALTHIGKVREENQDSIYQSEVGQEPLLLIVADGMGGHAGGSMASSMAIQKVTEQLRQGKSVKQAMRYANMQILRKAEADAAYDGMGTTMTLACICGSKAEIAQVGDSRAYLLQQGKLRQVTKDHSYVQFLVDQGKMSAQEARVSPFRNLITQALGMRGIVIDLYEQTLRAGDTLLLCSDGLYDYFEGEELEQLLLQQGSAQQKAELLLQLALERGGEDNISVILAIVPTEGGVSHA